MKEGPAHPLADKWREGAGLVVDGARFAAAALGSGGVPSSLGTAEYSTVGDAEGHPPGGAPAAETAAAAPGSSSGNVPPRHVSWYPWAHLVKERAVMMMIERLMTSCIRWMGPDSVGIRCGDALTHHT